VPLAAYLDLARASLGDVVALGPAAALTGPVARGDTATVERHLAAIDPEERPAYLALADRAARLAGRSGDWAPRMAGGPPRPVADGAAERATGRTGPRASVGARP
jgi:hypothetical protein